MVGWSLTKSGSTKRTTLLKTSLFCGSFCLQIPKQTFTAWSTNYQRNQTRVLPLQNTVLTREIQIEVYMSSVWDWA